MNINPMRTILQITVFIFFFFGGKAQVFENLFDGIESGETPTGFRDDAMFLTDSTFNYVVDVTTETVDTVSKSINLSFNNYGQIIETIDYVRDTSLLKWLPSQRTVYNYDEDGGLLEFHKYEWIDSSEMWQQYERRFYTPEEFGSTLTIVQLWNEENNSWENESRESAGFMNIGKPDFLYHENWDTITATWKKVWRLDFAYDEDEKIKAKLYSKWDSTGWVNHNQTFYFYDNDGIITDEYINAWYDDAWHRIARLVYTDNFDGHWQTMTHYIWNDVDSLWGVFKMDERTFDENDRVIFHTHKTWIVDHWQYTFSNLMEYDEHGNTIRHDLQKFLDGEWKTVSGSSFYVSDHNATAVPYVPDRGLVCVIPNPYSGQPIYVEATSTGEKLFVGLFDLTGRLHYRQRVQNKATFTIRKQLPGGVYFLSITGNGRILSTKKIVIAGN